MVPVDKIMNDVQTKLLQQYQSKLLSHQEEVY